jgi:hypothetical protein
MFFHFFDTYNIIETQKQTPPPKDQCKKSIPYPEVRKARKKCQD